MLRYWLNQLAFERLATGAAIATIVLAVHSSRNIEQISGAKHPHDQRIAEGRHEPDGIVISAYAGVPIYHRSDVRMVRSDGTDMTLHQIGWDGDALHFPIDGGVRAVKWYGAFGATVDFLHNKAIARLGFGAHGRKLGAPVVEEVQAIGVWKGNSAPSRVRLADVFQRLEFTHGHNLLLFTALFRPFVLTSSVKPYIGVGGGFALPHVEVGFSDVPQVPRTSEYQFGGPAAQLVAGVEINTNRMSYFIEYKITWASLKAALTGGQSNLNYDIVGDLVRQLRRWWRAEAALYGNLRTTIVAHQVVVGGGPRLNSSVSEALQKVRD